MTTVMNEKLTQLNTVAEVIRQDWNSETALSEKQSLMTLMANDDLLGFDGIKCLSSLSELGYYRDWLFSFKGRGYVISDASNGHYDYRCSIEEFANQLQTPSHQR